VPAARKAKPSAKPRPAPPVARERFIADTTTPVALPTRSGSDGRRMTPIKALGAPGYTSGGRPPAPDIADTPPVRLTAYLRPEQLLALRAEVRRRQGKGRRSDVSSLVREAIDALLARPAK
jgi:hypothetical protein